MFLPVQLHDCEWGGGEPGAFWARDQHSSRSCRGAIRPVSARISRDNGGHGERDQPRRTFFFQIYPRLCMSRQRPQAAVEKAVQLSQPILSQSGTVGAMKVGTVAAPRAGAKAKLDRGAI